MTAQEFANKIEEHAFEGDLVINNEIQFFLVKKINVINGIVEIVIENDE